MSSKSGSNSLTAAMLAAGLGAPRASDRRLQGIVGVAVLLDQIELELRRHDRLPAALRVELEDVAQHVSRRHRYPTAVGIEAIMDHLRGGLGGPWHAPHGLLIGLEDDVDFRRAHGIAGVGRVVAGHGLQKHALGQAHAAVLGELLRGHDLAAGDSGHVGDDGLDLGDAVIAEELPDLAHDPLGFFTLLRRAHGWPPRTLRTAPSKTDCSSPSTPGATVPRARSAGRCAPGTPSASRSRYSRSEEHTSELQSRVDLVCRLLLEKKKKKKKKTQR